jgi:hypothetical protein
MLNFLCWALRHEDRGSGGIDRSLLNHGTSSSKRSASRSGRFDLSTYWIRGLAERRIGFDAAKFSFLPELEPRPVHVSPLDHLLPPVLIWKYRVAPVWLAHVSPLDNLLPTILIWKYRVAPVWPAHLWPLTICSLQYLHGSILWPPPPPMDDDVFGVICVLVFADVEVK